jgi:BirA family biotin operon repressor/biotin-[acetyl-CoA-carboxylase] ligase
MKSSADWVITRVEAATSSSDLVRHAASLDAPEGTGFLVDTQTAGRGRRGAKWSSQQGGMYYSLLLHPSFPLDQWFGMSFVACLAIRDVIASHLPGHKVGLKWPNDVLVQDKGKICGILIEADGRNMILGTGVNIVPVAPLAGARLPAVALEDFGGDDVTSFDLACAYRDQLFRRYTAFASDGFAPVRREWLDHCLHIDASLTVHLADTMITGRFADLGADGTLHLVDDKGTRHNVSTGDVELMGTA